MNQNYAAALEILEFVESVSSGPSPSGPDPAPSGPDHTLLDRAILKPARNGLSTLHLLLGSLSPTFDLQTMALYVKNFQLTSAKQLLRLFRVRYPSAYKAEIVRKGSGKTNSEESSSEGSGEEGGEGEELLAGVQRDPLLPGGTGRVRQSYHYQIFHAVDSHPHSHLILTNYY